MVSFRVSWLSLIIATYSSFKHYFLPDNIQSKKERPILMNLVVQYFPRASNRFLSSFRCPPLSQSLAKGNLGISWLAKINQVVSLENLLLHPPWHIASLNLNQIRVLLGDIAGIGAWAVVVTNRCPVTIFLSLLKSVYLNTNYINFLNSITDDIVICNWNGNQLSI